MSTTAIVILVAAVVLFVIQRARYLREIEPDLELTSADRIRVDTMSSTVDQSWAYYIYVNVKNVSKNRATDMLFKVVLWIFPERGGARFLEIKYPLFPGFHQTELRPERTMEVPVYVGPNYATGLKEELERWGRPVSHNRCGFYTRILLEYYSNRELLLLLLAPWSGGRIRYKREIDLRYAFEPLERDGRTQYVPRRWDRMGLSEYIRDN